MQTVIQWDDDEPRPAHRAPLRVVPPRPAPPPPDDDDEDVPLPDEVEEQLAHIFAEALVQRYQEDAGDYGQKPHGFRSEPPGERAAEEGEAGMRKKGNDVRAAMALQRKVRRATRLRGARPGELCVCDGEPLTPLLREVLDDLMRGGTLTPRERHAAARLLRTIAAARGRADPLDALDPLEGRA